MKNFYLMILLLVASMLPRTVQAQEKNVWEIIQSEPDLIALSFLLAQNEDLVTFLQGPGPVTLFAPNAAAIGAIPQEEVAALLADTTGATAALINYHLVPDSVVSSQLVDGLMAMTLQGGSITITATETGFLVDSIPIVKADLIGTNGVVHIIGGLLTPPATPPTVMMVPQDLPLNFDADNVEYQLVGFGSADFTEIPVAIIDNPDPSGANTSARVVSIEKSTGAQTWAGASMPLASAIDFSNSSFLYAHVWSPRAGVPFLMKVEDTNSAADENGNPSIFAEVEALTTVGNAWEVLAFDMSGHPNFDAGNSYNQVVVFPDFGNMGAGETFFIDNIGTVDLTTTNTIDLAIERAIKIAPNPFDQQALLTWTNPENETYQIQILTITGQVIRTYNEVSGTNLIVNKNELSTGMYFLNIQDRVGNTGTLKMMVE